MSEQQNSNDNMNTYIGSIGNITSINTDKLNKTNNESKEKLLILQFKFLIL